MRLLTISRLCSTDRYKNIDLVIEAVKQLDFCTLNIVGDGDDRARLEALAEGNPSIMFLGQVDEQYKYALYEACDVFVLPSTKEGFGLVFVEAMSHGKPCIGSREGATPEVLGDGWYADSVEELVGVLTRAHHLLPEAMTVMACVARTRAQEFSYDRFKARVKELLR